MVSLNPDQKSSHNKSAITRFLSYIKIVKDTDCWEWTGSKNTDGYGKMRFNGKTIYIHRFIYEYFYGPIQAELELDHLCKNRVCANPEHLEAVSHTENILRGTSFVSINSKKTHCPQGHEYSLDNTYHTPAGRRACRTCQKDYQIKWKLKQKMEGVPG